MGNLPNFNSWNLFVFMVIGFDCGTNDSRKVVGLGESMWNSLHDSDDYDPRGDLIGNIVSTIFFIIVLTLIIV